jgi:LmbE family N-acetylglucosaminyl deacetylase
MATERHDPNVPGQPGLAAAVTGQNLDIPAVALAVGAHPDDVEFGAGGTLAKWAAAGCRIHHLVLTDGSKGTWDPDADTAALVNIREREQIEAHRRLGGAGADAVVFCRRVDGELIADAATRSEVARVIRMVRPDVVLGHDPWKRYRLHPDHRAAGQLVCDAIVAARDPHFHREHGLAPHRPSDLLLWEADDVDHIEDITTSLDTKLWALEAHESQFESTMHATDDAAMEQFRQRVRERGAQIGSALSMTTAEAFHRIDRL